MCSDLLRELNPSMNEEALHRELVETFATWFENYARANLIDNQYIRSLASRPLRSAICYPVYFVNGYRFHTKGHEMGRSTSNSGVAIPSGYGDYFGTIVEIMQLEYPAMPIKRTVLFKCEWYDPTVTVGVRIHDAYGLVDVHRRRRFNRFEPFILAMQASQVSYVPYPTTRRVGGDWVAVCKVKPRGWVQETAVPDTNENVPFQETEVESTRINTSYEPISLTNDNPEYVNVSGDEEDSEEDIEEDTEPDLESISSTEEEEDPGGYNEPYSDSD